MLNQKLRPNFFSTIQNPTKCTSMKNRFKTKKAHINDIKAAHFFYFLPYTRRNHDLFYS